MIILFQLDLQQFAMQNCKIELFPSEIEFEFKLFAFRTSLLLPLIAQQIATISQYLPFYNPADYQNRQKV